MNILAFLPLLFFFRLFNVYLFNREFYFRFSMQIFNIFMTHLNERKKRSSAQTTKINKAKAINVINKQKSFVSVYVCLLNSCATKCRLLMWNVHRVHRKRQNAPIRCSFCCRCFVFIEIYGIQKKSSKTQQRNNKTENNVLYIMLDKVYTLAY